MTSATTTDEVALTPAAGLQLLGEQPGSGYRKPAALVRRADGQVVQLTRLLYLTLSAIDGERDDAAIADRVSEEYGRRLRPEDVRLLADRKLRPLGLLRAADGSEPAVEHTNPLLALRLRVVVSDPKVTRRITTPFARLFRPAVVVPVVVAFLLIAGWVLFEKGLAAPTRNAFDEPSLLLLVFAATVVSAGFHEFGHAAACRYGGATPGVMGMGLYLVWPAFYTEVTDSYRLGRAGRVRVDLGGLYFNALFAVAAFAVWLPTRQDALLLLVATQAVQMVRQLAPLVRFDGYHVLADLTGVPDLYAHLKPTLLGMLPWRRNKTQAQLLKPWARAVVVLWVVVVAPLMAVTVVAMVLGLPRLLATGWQSLRRESAGLSADWAAGDPASAGVRVLAIVAIALPLLGALYLLCRMVWRLVKRTWTATVGRPVRRSLAGIAAVVALAALLVAWWPGERYRPVSAGERGTVADLVPFVRQMPPSRPQQRSEPVSLRAGATGVVSRPMWAGRAAPPPRAKPRLAVVMVPKTPPGAAPAAPAWVFPFNPPAAPGAGDNQALAINTTDGSTVYDVAFAMVWATDGADVEQRNEAWALASCEQCSTVAVAFQVVLVVGQADVVVPQNIAAAVNYSCVECVTVALARQLVVTLPADLPPGVEARLDALWERISRYGERIDEVPLNQVAAQLEQFAQDILDVLREEGVLPSAPPRPSAPSTPASAEPSRSAEMQPSETPSAQVSEPSPVPEPEVSEAGATPEASGSAEAEPEPDASTPVDEDSAAATAEASEAASE